MSFDVEADAYDRYMGAWSRQLSPRFAAFARVRPGQRALDVGCGPGALTAELVERLGAGAVAAVDPSARFVEAARERHPGVALHQASAEALPYRDGVFDVALAQLVVHFMRDPVAGIGEMARVTRSGGAVGACVWDFAGGRGPLGPFWEAARETDLDAIDESLLTGTGRGQLRELLASAGLAAVEETALAVERTYADFDAWWQPFLHGVGPGGAYVGRLTPARQAALRDRCRALLPSGTFRLTAFAWAARGTRS